MVEFNRVSLRVAREAEAALKATLEAISISGQFHPMGILVLPNGERQVAMLKWADDRESKLEVIGRFKHMARVLKAEVVILSSECWVKSFPDAAKIDMNKPASEYPDRSEAITVSVITKNERVNIVVPFERVGGAILSMGKPDIRYNSIDNLLGDVFNE